MPATLSTELDPGETEGEKQINSFLGSSEGGNRDQNRHKQDLGTGGGRELRELRAVREHSGGIGVQSRRSTYPRSHS